MWDHHVHWQHYFLKTEEEPQTVPTKEHDKFKTKVFNCSPFVRQKYDSGESFTMQCLLVLQNQVCTSSCLQQNPLILYLEISMPKNKSVYILLYHFQIQTVYLYYSILFWASVTRKILSCLTWFIQSVSTVTLIYFYFYRSYFYDQRGLCWSPTLYLVVKSFGNVRNPVQYISSARRNMSLPLSWCMESNRRY